MTFRYAGGDDDDGGVTGEGVRGNQGQDSARPTSMASTKPTGSEMVYLEDANSGVVYEVQDETQHTIVANSEV